MRLSRTTTTIVAATAVIGLGLPVAAPASAGSGGGRGPVVSDPITEGLFTALGLAVSPRGKTYVSQTFAGQLTKVNKDGTQTTIAESGSPDIAIAGVAIGPHSSVIYTLTGGDANGPVGLVKKIYRSGREVTLANTAAFEVKKNPDQVNSYGFQGLTPECANQVPAEIGGGFPYPGQVDSNTYAVAHVPGYGKVVADAAGNDLLRITRRGKLRTLAVLPPVPTTVTEEIAAGIGLPDCVVGAKYNFDPVPTDVEVGPDGKLYVSSLPGGPEDASLGARGGVFRVNPWTGRVKRIASGFLGAVDLAVSPRGKIYVAEMFGGAISKVRNGGAVKVVDLPNPGALEWARGRLYATTSPDLFSPQGSIVKIRP